LVSAMAQTIREHRLQDAADGIDTGEEEHRARLPGWLSPNVQRVGGRMVEMEFSFGS